MSKVILYTKDYCPYCTKAKILFDKKGVKYTDIDITNEPKLQEEMFIKSKGKKTVPQIFIAEKYIGGCDDLYALEEKKELDKILL